MILYDFLSHGKKEKHHRWAPGRNSTTNGGPPYYTGASMTYGLCCCAPFTPSSPENNHILELGHQVALEDVMLSQFWSLKKYSRSYLKQFANMNSADRYDTEFLYLYVARVVLHNWWIISSSRHRWTFDDGIGVAALTIVRKILDQPVGLYAQWIGIRVLDSVRALSEPCTRCVSWIGTNPLCRWRDLDTGSLRTRKMVLFVFYSHGFTCTNDKPSSPGQRCISWDANPGPLFSQDSQLARLKLLIGRDSACLTCHVEWAYSVTEPFGRTRFYRNGFPPIHT